MLKKENKKIIGVIGGMGPLATIEFQKQILNYTDAKKDQDHISVIVYNNPQIPDRTESLINNDGSAFVSEIIFTGKKLISNGSTVLCIPCVTAHSRFKEIQKQLSVPLINMIELTADKIKQDNTPQPILILATNGTIREKIFEKVFLERSISFITPDDELQDSIMKIIYSIKAGKDPKTTLLKKLRGAKSVLLGCTELELYHEYFEKNDIKVINPLRILAEYVSRC